MRLLQTLNISPQPFHGLLQICEKISKDGWSTEYHPEAAEAVAYSSRAGEMVTYDNKQSMMDKVDYITRLGLGGAMIWTLDFDDFTGKFCNEGRYPLLPTINQVGFLVLEIRMGCHIV